MYALSDTWFVWIVNTYMYTFDKFFVPQEAMSTTCHVLHFWLEPMTIFFIKCSPGTNPLVVYHLLAWCHSLLVAGAEYSYYGVVYPVHTVLRQHIRLTRCWLFVRNGAFGAGLYVHSADGALLVLGEPLVHTFDVEQVHAGKAPGKQQASYHLRYGLKTRLLLHICERSIFRFSAEQATIFVCLYI